MKLDHMMSAYKAGKMESFGLLTNTRQAFSASIKSVQKYHDRSATDEVIKKSQFYDSHFPRWLWEL